MARLPARPGIPDGEFTVVTSIAITPNMNDQLIVEARRTGARGRSEMIRWIVEEYFNQPLEEEKEDANEQAGNEERWNYGNRFQRYLGGDSVRTPKSEPHPTGSTSSVPGGSDGHDSEGFGVCLALSCPTDSSTTEVPAEGGRDATGRVDQPG